MAKLRDSEVKDNLIVLGEVTAKGKAISMEGHRHTPEEITGLKEYIKANGGGGSTETSGNTNSGTVTLPENINAKTLDGHTADEFALKTDIIRSAKYIVDRSIYNNFRINCLKITFNNTPVNTFVILEDPLYKITLNNRGIIQDFDLKDKVDPGLLSNDNSLPTMTFSGNSVYFRGIGSKYDLGFIDIKVLGPDNTAYDSVTVEATPQNNSNLGSYFYLNINTKASNVNYHAAEFKRLYSSVNGATYAIKPMFTNKYTYGNSLIIPTYGESYIVDLKSGKYIRAYNKVITSNIERSNAKISRSYGLFFTVDLSMFDSINDIIVISQFAINTDKKITSLDSISYDYQGGNINNNPDLYIEKLRALFNYSESQSTTEINCKINGIPFNGKDDITIPGSTNATTLDGLSSSQFIKVNDVMAGTGKIPRFDAQGFLVYPDGSKERIENV